MNYERICPSGRLGVLHVPLESGSALALFRCPLGAGLFRAYVLRRCACIAALVRLPRCSGWPRCGIGLLWQTSCLTATQPISAATCCAANFPFSGSDICHQSRAAELSPIFLACKMEFVSEPTFPEVYDADGSVHPAAYGGALTMPSFLGHQIECIQPSDLVVDRWPVIAPVFRTDFVYGRLSKGRRPVIFSVAVSGPSVIPSRIAPMVQEVCAWSEAKENRAEMARVQNGSRASLLTETRPLTRSPKTDLRIFSMIPHHPVILIVPRVPGHRPPSSILTELWWTVVSWSLVIPLRCQMARRSSTLAGIKPKRSLSARCSPPRRRILANAIGWSQCCCVGRRMSPRLLSSGLRRFSFRGAPRQSTPVGIHVCAWRYIYAT